MDKTRLIGRQTPTQGGPLDLLGIDADGRLVVFELKRGTLTRDAVTQALDYASDLDQMAYDDLCQHLEAMSGKGGTEKIEDFGEWYSSNYFSIEDALAKKPRIVLVGLGLDDRASRIIGFLIDCAVDIQVLTFHAFEHKGELLLCRSVEVAPTVGTELRRVRGGNSRRENLPILLGRAKELGVGEFLQDVKDTIREGLATKPWPNKYSYSFYLPDTGGSGSNKMYVNLSMEGTSPGSLTVKFERIAYEAASEALRSLQKALGTAVSFNPRHSQMLVNLDAKTWPQAKGFLVQALSGLEEARRAILAEDEPIEYA
jgi:hypothetical protein